MSDDEFSEDESIPNTSIIFQKWINEKDIFIIYMYIYLYIHI